jgi:hypothetical protein
VLARIVAGEEEQVLADDLLLLREVERAVVAQRRR